MNLSCLASIDCEQGAVRAVRFNVDGTYCLSCGSDRKVKLWNPMKCLLLKTYGGHANEVLDATSSCDNSQIASGSVDKSVILWDVTTGQPVRRLRGHASTISCVRFNEDSSVVISGSQDNSVILWDTKSKRNEPIQVLQEAKDSITSIDINGPEIVTTSLDCRVRRYDIRMGELTTDFIGDPVVSISLTNDNQCYVVSCSNDKVRLFDKDNGELLSDYSGHKCSDYVIENCVNYKDTHIMSGSVDGFIYCWELVSGSVIKLATTNKKKSVINSLSPHPFENLLLSACGGVIEVWGTPKGDSE